MRDLGDEWRFGGSLIAEDGEPRLRPGAFDSLLSIPPGTDPMSVRRAAREYGNAQLADHKYAMVLYDHQSNVHVHIGVRAESKHGRHLHPHKTDLHRWCQGFVTKLGERRIEAKPHDRPRAARYDATRSRGN